MHAQLADVQLAVRWLRGHASSFRLDPSRICAWGISAGGHLALLLATLSDAQPSDMASLYPEQTSQVQCAIADLCSDRSYRSSRCHTAGSDPQFVRGSDARAGFRALSLGISCLPGNRPHGPDVPCLWSSGPPGTRLRWGQRMYKEALNHGVRAILIAHDGGHVLEGLPENQKLDIFAQFR